ncbi:MAG: hypothetical protein ACNA7G_09865 [Methylobacter sp.]
MPAYFIGTLLACWPHYSASALAVALADRIKVYSHRYFYQVPYCVAALIKEI